MKENLYNHLGVENGRLRHTNKMMKITVVLGIIITAIILFFAIPKIIELSYENTRLNNTIKQYKNVIDRNRRLERQKMMSDKLLKGSQEENRRLRRINNALQNKTTYKKSKPKTKYTHTKTQYQDNYVPQRKILQPVPKNIKKYQNFSHNIKLISDSRIRKRADNRLQSSQSIYGRYYAKNYSLINAHKNQIANVKCGYKKTEYIYNVDNKCSMQIGNKFDTVYLGEMDSKRIMDFDYKKHMIECEYHQVEGIMHSCKKKLLTRK